METLLTITTNALQVVAVWVDVMLKNLDPSLFQSVIVGILMVLIFVGEQIFTETKTQKGRGEFSKMVIFYEILNVVYIPIIAVFALTLFAFFKDDLNGNSIETVVKVATIICLSTFVFILLRPIFKFQEFFRGKRYKFELLFLKSLNFSSFLRFRNKVKAEKMVRAWNSFWSETTEFNERSYTKVFITHVEEAISNNELELAVQLSNTYVSNIEKRDRFSIGYEILPKIFEWNEILWNKQQSWLKGYSTEKKIRNALSQKHFPTFSAWVLKLYRRTNEKKDRFWKWHYFGGDFFKAIISVLLRDGHGPYQLFTALEKHVDESLIKLEKISDKQEKDRYDHYITGLFASLCPTFFNEIENAPSRYDIWEHNFPSTWKIASSNTTNGIPRVVLHQFLQWSRDRVYKDREKADFDNDLTEVINGIFPNVHSSLFTTFFLLFFSADVKSALKKEPNFHIFGTSVSWTGSGEMSKTEMDKKLTEMIEEKENSNKHETIRIVLEFFNFWHVLKIYKDDITEDEINTWDKLSKDDRKSIVKRVRKTKLAKVKADIESDEIMESCKGDERKEYYRQNFHELINLLIEEVEKQ